MEDLYTYIYIYIHIYIYMYMYKYIYIYHIHLYICSIYIYVDRYIHHTCYIYIYNVIFVSCILYFWQHPMDRRRSYWLKEPWLSSTSKAWARGVFFPSLWENLGNTRLFPWLSMFFSMEIWIQKRAFWWMFPPVQ